MNEQPLLRVEQLTRYYGARPACVDVRFDLWPGEVLLLTARWRKPEQDRRAP